MMTILKTISKKQVGAFIACVILAGALSASAYVAPLAGPTQSNTRGPIHIGAEDQIKDGGLQVNTFQSRGDARLQQNAIFKGTVHGGTPADSTSTVTIASDTDVNGLLHAKEYLNSQAISHVGNAEPQRLCANDTGVIEFCAAVSSQPLLIQVAEVPTTNLPAFYTTQMFWVGPAVPAGATYVLTMGQSFVVNAVAGDTPQNIALKMVTMINSKTEAQWREYWPSNSTPPASGPGFPPRAAMTGDASFKVTAYPGHSFAGSASTSPYPGYCGDMVDGKLIECQRGNPVQVFPAPHASDLYYCDPSNLPTFYVKPPAWSISEGAEVYVDEYMRNPFIYQGDQYIRQYPGGDIHILKTNSNVVGPTVDYYACY